MNLQYINSARGILLACAAALGLAGCASSGSVGVAAADCPVPAQAEDGYRIGAGDALNIVVWRNAELTATVPVRPDGKVSTPLVDDVVAAGKTPSDLARDMEAVLAEYIRTPKVSVIVTGQGPANRIRVVGEVGAPQSLPFREDLKMLDVLVGVGGLTEFAAGNRARIVRQIEGESTECGVRLEDLLSGDLSQNVAVFPGDVLIVPESLL